MKLVIITCIFIALLINNTICAENLNDKVFLLREKIMNKEIPYSNIEDNYIALLNEAKTTKDKILILMELIKESERDTNPDKVIKYCQEILLLPLKPTEQCSIISYIGRALQEKRDDQIKIGELYLRGIVITVKNATEEEVQSPPAVGRYRYIGDSKEIEEELKKQHNEEIMLREKIVANNELLKYREQFINDCVLAFSKVKDRKNEYLNLLDKYLKDYPIVQNKIITSISER